MKFDNSISSFHVTIYATATDTVSDRNSTLPIVDQNKQANSHTHLQTDRPYIALNSETYILIMQQELHTCKRIGYEIYYEEIFVVKHKSKYSCESAIYSI